MSELKIINLRGEERKLKISVAGELSTKDTKNHEEKKRGILPKVFLRNIERPLRISTSTVVVSL